MAALRTRGFEAHIGETKSRPATLRRRLLLDGPRIAGPRAILRELEKSIVNTTNGGNDD